MTLRLSLQTFWHSSAHVLGEALEACFGVRLTIGPAIEEGFYYDCYMGERTLTDAERPILEKKIEQVLWQLYLPGCYVSGRTHLGFQYSASGMKKSRNSGRSA